MDDYVTVETYDTTTNAHIAMGRLRAEGIKARLADEHFVTMDWLYSIALGGIKLQVPRGQAQWAREILDTDYSEDLDL
ncbi:MAG TPA: hypothetical protein VFH85_03820 [Gammaproteobacteria bacterium]|nr:hypothetical protein [Gammaproteobacteria bacterium]